MPLLIIALDLRLAETGPKGINLVIALLLSLQSFMNLKKYFGLCISMYKLLKCA